jgi:hypothetical protein
VTGDEPTVARSGEGFHSDDARPHHTGAARSLTRTRSEDEGRRWGSSSPAWQHRGGTPVMKVKLWRLGKDP